MIFFMLGRIVGVIEGPAIAKILAIRVEVIQMQVSDKEKAYQDGI